MKQVRLKIYDYFQVELKKSRKLENVVPRMLLKVTTLSFLVLNLYFTDFSTSLSIKIILWPDRGHKLVAS